MFPGGDPITGSLVTPTLVVSLNFDLVVNYLGTPDPVRVLRS